MVSLPHYPWFFQKQGGECLTNVYSGSICDDPHESSTNKTTFHYRACVEVNEHDEAVAIRAVCFWRMPWNKGCVVKTTENEFEPSQEGVAAATAWIEAQYKQEHQE